MSSQQRSILSAKESSSVPPPLPARKCSASSGGPVRDGMVLIREEAPSDAPHAAASTMNDDDDEDVDDVIVAYVDDIESIRARAAAVAAVSVRAKSQPLPPIPNYPPTKPKTTANSSGSQGGAGRMTPNSVPKKQEEHAGAKFSRGRSSEPAISSVPKPPLPFRKISGANTVIGGQSIATDVNSNELEEVFKNLGRKPVRISSEDNETTAGVSLPKPPMPPAARTTAGTEKHKNSTPSPCLTSEVKAVDKFMSEMEQQSWYHGVLSRTECEIMIRSEGQNGGFIVRRRVGDSDVDGFPLALSVLHNDRVNHFRIRRRPDNTFALGNEKTNEYVFNDILEMISFHRNTPILLSNNAKVKLTGSPPRR